MFCGNSIIELPINAFCRHLRVVFM